MTTIDNSSQAFRGGAAWQANESGLGSNVQGTAGSDVLHISRAEGLAGMLGLYRVSMNGESRYMTKSELENTTFNLGKGNDIAVVDPNVDANVQINGGKGDDMLIGGRGNDTLHGGDGNDFISGGAGNDRLFGGRGNDLMDGGHGNDLMRGGRGNDLMLGGNGNDRLRGDRGDDLMFGGNGKDVMRGGRGDDTVFGGLGADRAAGGPGRDTVAGARPIERSPSAPRAGATAPTARPGEPVAQSNRTKEAMDYFVSQGWTREQAAGIVANLQAESNLNPGARGDSGLAYGIGQWHPDRQANFRKAIGRDIQGSTFEQQLKFVQHELTHSESGAGKRLQGATSAREAGAIVSRYYERPADANGEASRRGARAEQVLGGWRPSASAAPAGGSTPEVTKSGAWPVPGHHKINHADKAGEGEGAFGTSRGGGSRSHKGLDIEAPVGSRVSALRDGTVTGVNRDPGGYGLWIEVSHGNGLTTRYAHLNGADVKVGDRVKAGQQIGAVGRSGNTPSSGDAHLHFETRVNGTAVDPQRYLR